MRGSAWVLQLWKLHCCSHESREMLTSSQLHPQHCGWRLQCPCRDTRREVVGKRWCRLMVCSDTPVWPSRNHLGTFCLCFLIFPKGHIASQERSEM